MTPAMSPAPDAQATRGGVAPGTSCDMATKGRREVVQYQADYIFWKPA